MIKLGVKDTRGQFNISYEQENKFIMDREEMKALNELNEAVKTVIEVSNRINEETNKAVLDQAPLIIHQRFCGKLVSIAKKNDKKKLDEVPEFMDMLKAIEILEKLYPELIKNK